MDHSEEPDKNSNDADAPARTSRMVSVSLVLIGLGCIVFAVSNALSGGLPEGHETIPAVVTDSDSRFEWNSARRKNELAFYPTVRFTDPASGNEHRIKLNDESRASVGSTIEVSMRPGSPTSARLAGGSQAVGTAIIVVIGIGLIGIGISSANPVAVVE